MWHVFGGTKWSTQPHIIKVKTSNGTWTIAKCVFSTYNFFILKIVHQLLCLAIFRLCSGLVGNDLCSWLCGGDSFFIGCYGWLTGMTVEYGWPARAAKVHPKAGRMVCFPLGLGSTIAPLFLYPKHKNNGEIVAVP